MRIGIVQDGPAFLNKKETLDKTMAYLAAASQNQVDVVVFGENWFSGYPIWLDVCADVNIWDAAPVKEVWAKTFENGLALESTELSTIRAFAKKASITIILGANEPVAKGLGNGTLYNSIFTIANDGSIANHHRKLMPTYTERIVHGRGNGAGLRAVDTTKGRIGSLICWEHWMPLSRQAMHDEAEDVHFALWPQVKEQNHVASLHYALEGRCYTVAVGQVMHQDELPNQLTLSDKIMLPPDGLIMRGGSAIYGPDGSVIVAPLYQEKKLMIADYLILKLTEDKQLITKSYNPE
jgi:predicted amidohydrolase